jgi:small GTP-binding protein
LLDKIAALLDTARWAKHLVSPWHIVLAGLPNAGKSSLLNALVGYERAIVFAQPGTTRDVVTAAAAYDGWRWELRDTAGLRATDDPLEAAGIERTDAMLAASDVTVLVIDGTRPWSESETLRRAHPRAICVRNKSDLWTGNVAWEGEAPAEPSSRENSIQQKDAKIAKEIAARRVSEGDERQFSTEGSKGNEEGIAGGNNPWDAKAHSEPLKNPIPLTPALSRIQSNDMVAPLSGEGENAAPLAVSATTGAGLEELRAAIHARLNLPVWNEIGACVWDAALAHDLRTLQHVLTNDPAALPAALRELRTWIE